MNTPPVASGPAAAEAARFIRDRLPSGGLFADQAWRLSPSPFVLGAALTREIETLGRVLLQFNRAVNLLYRQSVAGKQPDWIARWLDLGKPAELIALQRAAAFKNDLPRVLRPDLVLTEAGVTIAELDGVPGGIGLTAWLNETYSECGMPDTEGGVIGGPAGMLTGFAAIFDNAPRVHIVVSDEAATYRPEMRWLAERLNAVHAARPIHDESRSTDHGSRLTNRLSRGADHGPPVANHGFRFAVREATFHGFSAGDAVYRFFELFDLPNVPNAGAILEGAAAGRLRLTPPAKPLFEEKMLFALLWNRNLREFWWRELGEGFFRRLLELVPYTWIMDPSSLPPHAVLPELNLTDWQQLKTLSQRERALVLKVSGYSAEAWGARGVYLGSDLSAADWGAAVDRALGSFPRSPYILQRYHQAKRVEAVWFDFDANRLVPMTGRVRLCPYYFVAGEGDAARAVLGGVLATICPADKKILHGMRDAILVPARP